MGEHATRPPSYLSTASLAWELDCAESTVHELVNRGILPKPVRLSGGCIRHDWEQVKMALASLQGGTSTTDVDPYMEGARNAAKDETK